MHQRSAIIGVNGYIGQHLYNYLEANGNDVVGFGRSGMPKASISQYQVLDVLNDHDFLNRFSEFDQVYYLAGRTGTLNSFSDFKGFFEINQLGLCNLLNSLKNGSKMPRIIYPSTRLVYKGSELSIEETGVQESKTIYAVSKLAGENTLMAFNSLYAIPYTVLRICVPYGNLLSMDYSYGTIGFFLNNARAGKDIILYGDGTLKRTFTHISDLCSQLGLVGSSTEEPCFTLNSDGEAFSLFEVANLIAAKYGVGIQFKEWPGADLNIESGSTVFNSEKIRKTFSYSLQHKFSDWLNSF